MLGHIAQAQSLSTAKHDAENAVADRRRTDGSAGGDAESAVDA